MVEIDGSYGEGGGQVLRTSLTLSAITGQPVHLRKVRAGRRNPGLAAQHLTGLLALAEVCRAEVSGAALGSTDVTFEPGGPPLAGNYLFDVTNTPQGGSAGSVTLIFQSVLLPLALAGGESTVTLKGGTHVPWSPSYHYLEHVFLPLMNRLGLQAVTQLDAWGFYPAGGGQVTATILNLQSPISNLHLPTRGQLIRLHGLAAAANLPAHIPQRMADRARGVLRENRLNAEMTPARLRAAGPGAGVFLATEFEHLTAGFGALGEKGKPSEQVAEEACLDLIAYLNHGSAAVDMHLADQLLLPLALAQGTSNFTTCRVSRHLLTNAQVIQQFIATQITIEGDEGGPGQVTVVGHPLTPNI